MGRMFPNDYLVTFAWAYDAVQGKDIVMQSDGAQIKYCYLILRKNKMNSQSFVLCFMA